MLKNSFSHEEKNSRNMFVPAPAHNTFPLSGLELVLGSNLFFSPSCLDGINPLVGNATHSLRQRLAQNSMDLINQAQSIRNHPSLISWIANNELHYTMLICTLQAAGMYCQQTQSKTAFELYTSLEKCQTNAGTRRRYLCSEIFNRVQSCEKTNTTTPALQMLQSQGILPQSSVHQADIVLRFFGKSIVRFSCENETCYLMQRLVEKASPKQSVNLLESMLPEISKLVNHPRANYVVTALLKNIRQLQSTHHIWNQLVWALVPTAKDIIHCAANRYGSFVLKKLVPYLAAQTKRMWLNVLRNSGGKSSTVFVIETLENSLPNTQAC